MAAYSQSRRRSTPLEEYALLSDLSTGSLVSRDGSVDWLCLPRFDSPSVFSALLGDAEDGRWALRAVDGEVVDRRYLPGTFVLETTWRTPGGTVRVTDFLPRSDDRGDLVRRVECLDGEVEVEHDLRMRFDYARATPWTRTVDMPDGERALLSLAGPDGILVTGPELHWPGEGRHEHDSRAGNRASRLEGRFTVAAGQTLDWDLSWFPSYLEPPEPPDTDAALHATIAFWTEWTDRAHVEGEHREAVSRSLLVLRALTHHQTGGIVAAPTTSLPERFGGGRNWD